MQNAPILQDELLRLNDLLSHHILDSGEEESFNELLAIAAHICGCPTALISIVDKERQWFKSKINLLQNELPRNTSFCGHAIATNDIFIVNDTAKDKRFYDNPNVTGHLNIRFYAGAQIVSKSGFNLGTVCVIDHQPKTLTAEQQETLKKIASQVSRMIELKKQQAGIKKTVEQENNFESLFVQSSFPKLIFSSGIYDIIDANEAAVKLYGYSRKELLKMTAMDLKSNKSKVILKKRVEKVESSIFPVTLRSKHISKHRKQLHVSVTISSIMHRGQEARLADISDITGTKILTDKIKDTKKEAGKKMFHAVLKAKQKERSNITDALRENINQVLACTNLYLSIAKTNETMRMQMIEKSQGNILIAMEEIKKLYRTTSVAQQENHLQDSIEQLVVKYELFRLFDIHFSFEGDENSATEKTRLLIYRIISEYFDTALTSQAIKNVWLTVQFSETIQLIIKNDNRQTDSKKKKEYLHHLKMQLHDLNGKAALHDCTGLGCTLHISIPNEMKTEYEHVLMEEELMN
jgi:PAS domain S-box-containing protein